jgi:glycosyltransferase involved in cell wall biosynthesis
VKLSVSILSWNTLNTLKMTIEMLKDELKGIDHEIIVVDQSSNDGTHGYLRSENIISCFNPFNKGISKGKNQGIMMSKGEYIFLLDGDVVPVPNSIRLLIKFLDDNPDKYAIGMYPNRFAIEPNREGGQQHHEDYCHALFEPVKSRTACLFYGLYRNDVFYKCLMDESGEYAEEGYGWEDHDFYMQMEEAGMPQYVAHINHKNGKYYHAINSSIKPHCMGYAKYMESSQKRAKQFHAKWDKKECLAK